MKQKCCGTAMAIYHILSYR